MIVVGSMLSQGQASASPVSMSSNGCICYRFLGCAVPVYVLCTCVYRVAIKQQLEGRKASVGNLTGLWLGNGKYGCLIYLSG